MDSLKEQTRPATKSSKPPRIEVDEEMVRRMIVGLASLDSKVVIPLYTTRNKTRYFEWFNPINQTYMLYARMADNQS